MKNLLTLIFLQLSFNSMELRAGEVKEGEQPSLPNILPSLGMIVLFS